MISVIHVNLRLIWPIRHIIICTPREIDGVIGITRRSPSHCYVLQSNVQIYPIPEVKLILRSQVSAILLPLSAASTLYCRKNMYCLL